MAGNIGEIIQEHPAIVIGGVLALGFLLFTGKKSSTSGGTTLGAASSSTAVSGEMLQNALDAQRQQIEDELARYFENNNGADPTQPPVINNGHEGNPNPGGGNTGNGNGGEPNPGGGNYGEGDPGPGEPKNVGGDFGAPGDGWVIESLVNQRMGRSNYYGF